MTPTTQAIITTWASSCTTEPEWDSWKRARVECRLGYIEGRDLPVTRIRRWAEDTDVTTARAIAIDVVRSFRTQAYDIDWERYWQ